jgi:imidazolonepropionase-like amidohydrolase
MAEAGYPVGEALAAATSVAAQACGLENDTGRLAVGHAADLLVVDGDLSLDASLLGNPQLVVLRGLPDRR